MLIRGKMRSPSMSFGGYRGLRVLMNAHMSGEQHGWQGQDSDMHRRLSVDINYVEPHFLNQQETIELGTGCDVFVCNAGNSTHEEQTAKART